MQELFGAGRRRFHDELLSRGILVLKQCVNVMPPAFSHEWALFLDIDGTLVEFEDHPDAVRIDPDLKRNLSALCDATGGAIALISGRSVKEVDRLFAPLRLPTAGQHGTERRSAEGVLHLHAPVSGQMHEVAEHLVRFATLHPGLIVENKGMSLALHYRLAPELIQIAQARMRELLMQLGPEYGLQEGKQVIEIRPTGRDKGMAIEEFMLERPFAGKVPVFVGDDQTDEFGFACVNRLGGRSVKVGSGASVALWRLADALAVRRWLRIDTEEKRDKALGDRK